MDVPALYFECNICYGRGKISQGYVCTCMYALLMKASSWARKEDKSIVAGPEKKISQGYVCMYALLMKASSWARKEDKSIVAGPEKKISQGYVCMYALLMKASI